MSQLGGSTRALRANEASELDRILAGTTVTKSAAEALQQQIVASGREIERLRGDLSRARIEVRIDPLARILNRKGFDRILHAVAEALRASMSDPAHARCRPRGHDLGRRECDADRG